MQHLLPHFDAMILSPGPGSPERRADFGFGLEFLRRAALYQLPTLGVCLGHQGLAVAFGGRIKRAHSIQHGCQSVLQFPDDASQGAGLFLEVNSGSIVTRYNSLTVEAKSLPDCLEVTAFADDAPNAVPLPAPSEIVRSRKSSPTSNFLSERCILGLSHRSLPLWGVQFHPESIESRDGARMLYNFTQLAYAWHKRCSKAASIAPNVIPASVKAEGQGYVAAVRAQDPFQATSSLNSAQTQSVKMLRLIEHQFKRTSSSKIPNATKIFSRIFRSKSRQAAVWLDSARQGDPQANRSYMASPSFVISHRQASDTSTASTMMYSSEKCSWTDVSQPSDESFWHFMELLQRRVQDATEFCASPSSCNQFRGGFVGYWGYEMKSDSLGLQQNETISQRRESKSPDAEFAFCPAVLQYDHALESWSAFVLIHHTQALSSRTGSPSELLSDTLGTHVQGLGLSEQGAHSWIQSVQNALDSADCAINDCSEEIRDLSVLMPRLRPLDNQRDYTLKVEAARFLISQGESYELCLTTHFVGRLPQSSSGPADHFELYQALRARNPAPYSAYIQLPDLPERKGTSGKQRAILSTSPERFLSRTSSGAVEMKPIKGTVPRAGYGRGEDSSLASLSTRWAHEEDVRRRRALEADPKERAENLMIVDLIRADLLSFCYPHSVTVPKLMKVESYQSVHQLVTTVTGQAKDGVGPVEALRRCFPPGSMTGAPKRRSVTLLERLEGKTRSSRRSSNFDGRQISSVVNGRSTKWTLRHRPRGPYAGALGWFGVDGASDFSVVIRTAVIVDGEITIGAGGAITYLSDAEKEWQEVLHKVQALAHIDLDENISEM